jgi:hypothetical protein
VSARTKANRFIPLDEMRRERGTKKSNRTKTEIDFHIEQENRFL